MIAHSSRLEEYTVRILADTWLRQREALVDISMEHAKHLTTIHVAGVLHAHISWGDGQQSPQGLLERGVHAVDGVLDQIDVKVALSRNGDKNNIVTNADLFTLRALFGGWVNGPPAGFTLTVWLKTDVKG